MLSLLAISALAIVYTIIYQIIYHIIHDNGLDDYVAPALHTFGLLLGVLLAAWGWKAIRRARARRPEPYQRTPLSCDELRVARSKLMKHRNAKKS